MLLKVTVGGMTPLIGYTMFAVSASWPFVGVFIVCMVIVPIFPGLATWMTRVL
jgi:hypothetical protein